MLDDINDYYKLLNITKNTTQEEIKIAYRKRAHELHPDKNKNTDTTEQFQKLNKAYETLSDFNVDEEIKKIACDMAETMYAENGIGLAAPQVGITKQIIVVDVDDELVTIINPEITVAGEKEKMEEGCLCLPKVSVEFEKLANAHVEGLDLDV